ncbi:hypothetical protein AAHB37_15405 [Glutamicibacter halophytocola]|uniref:hypothetical protein n=1 Tax=Glutamicibacter halophytocola TaxID=1933880 RepID=UPI00321BA0A7
MMFNAQRISSRARKLSLAVAAGALLGTSALSGCSVANSGEAGGGSGAPAAGRRHPARSPAARSRRRSKPATPT